MKEVQWMVDFYFILRDDILTKHLNHNSGTNIEILSVKINLRFSMALTILMKAKF